MTINAPIKCIFFRLSTASNIRSFIEATHTIYPHDFPTDNSLFWHEPNTHSLQLGQNATAGFLQTQIKKPYPVLFHWLLICYGILAFTYKALQNLPLSTKPPYTANRAARPLWSTEQGLLTTQLLSSCTRALEHWKQSSSNLYVCVNGFV